MHLRSLLSSFLFVALLLTATAGSAQMVTGTISGRVADSTGAVIPAATVQIQNIETGLSRNIQTDTAGRYEATSLPLGSYSVTAQQSEIGRAHV